jgi:hypothetical protein
MNDWCDDNDNDGDGVHEVSQSLSPGLVSSLALLLYVQA